jgi:hypothetical protein
VKALDGSARAWRDGTSLLNTQYEGQMIDYTFVGYFAQNLLEQQDLAAQARGDVSLALVEIYRAIGGGWQVRIGAGADAPQVTIRQEPPANEEEVPAEPLPQPLVPAQAEDRTPQKLPPTASIAAPSEPWAQEPE